jgi:hypothetical protein
MIMTKFKWEKQYYTKKKRDNGRLYVKPGCNIKVRLVGEPVRIVRIFTQDDICLPVDSEKTANLLKAKFPEKVKNISVRYACWCFDRHDDRMKVLEMPKSVFSMIDKQTQSGKKKISEQEEGCDFKISTNGKTGMDVRYTVDSEKDTSLTDIEKHMILVQQANKKRPYDLTKLFKSCSYLDAGVKLSKQKEE